MEVKPDSGLTHLPYQKTKTVADKAVSRHSWPLTPSKPTQPHTLPRKVDICLPFSGVSPGWTSHHLSGQQQFVGGLFGLPKQKPSSGRHKESLAWLMGSSNLLFWEVMKHYLPPHHAQQLIRASALQRSCRLKHFPRLKTKTSLGTVRHNKKRHRQVCQSWKSLANMRKKTGHVACEECLAPWRVKHKGRACFATAKLHPSPLKREIICPQEHNSITHGQWKLSVFTEFPSGPSR